MQPTLAPQTGRLDRHVRRSYLRLDEGVSRHRIAYSLEEALRLAVLPGEEEGRIYCFRRISLSGIPAEANRKVWMERVEHALTAFASQAVHASQPRASAADAVYFNNLEEALESLLSNAVHAPEKGPWTKPAWYSASLLGIESGTTYSSQIPAILERLRPPAFAPGAAAAIVFAALGDADPAALLSAIPTSSLREWVHELEDSKSAADAPAVALPQKLRTALERAASQFGWKDPSTIWLAVQAILCVAPNTASPGTAAKRARATLRKLEVDQRQAGADREALTIRDAHSQTLVFDDDEHASALPGIVHNRREEPSLESVQRSSTQAQAENSAPEIETSSSPEHSALEHPRSTQAIQDDSREFPVRAVFDAASTVPIPTLLGAPTAAAGMFFLLNALRRLGIANALDACPALADAAFATHILKRLASHAEVADNDPILLCLRSPHEEFALDAEVRAALQDQPKAWPVGFTPPSRTSFNSEYVLRVWVLAVKRWCWRAARLPVREIVQRKGRVWHTRTDIDVTLPLSAADIRIRRIGLDIDPGWLPWLGVHGRVVRFHYTDRDQGGHAC